MRFVRRRPGAGRLRRPKAGPAAGIGPERSWRDCGPVLSASLSRTACLRDFAVLSEYRVEDVLPVLDDLVGPNEDAAVWAGPRCVCVMRGDKSVFWLAPEYRPADEAAA